MSTAAAAAGAEALSSTQAYQDDSGVPGVDLLQVQQRYGEERAKRLRDEGNSQYVDLSLSGKFQQFLEDPWVDTSRVKDAQSQFTNGRSQFLILGAGFGGLLYAIRQIQAGIPAENIRIVDTATGFGGTWYWNRYPGLMCDIESYCYLPLLEETGYVPKHRYSYGDEIREYVELLAKKWGLVDSAVWQTKAEKLSWDEEKKEWQVELVQRRQAQAPQTFTIRTQFVSMANAPLNWPKLPGLPGIEDFKGEVFHTSRWNYNITGGSQKDPSLTSLQDKRVAIIGTGATAVQVVPHLAKWAKQLFVVQRTPSGIDVRDQRETDLDWFRKEVATGPGWQRERLRNFHEYMFSTGNHPSVNLVDDGWTHAHTLVASAGNPAGGPKSLEEGPGYIDFVNKLDLPRQERIRKRVEAEVKDPLTAKKLQAWYPTWCKRPAFHDEYLPAFNRSNVTLVDTDGKGLERLTEDSIVSNGQSYPVDVIVFATGFRAPFGGSPAEKANVSVTGRNGVSMSEEWATKGPSTLHGTLDPNFPNLFLPGLWQASISPNNLFHLDCSAITSAYIISHATKEADGKPFAIAATKAAAEEWGNEVLLRAGAMGAMAGCTPGYFNAEGDVDRLLGSGSPEIQLIMAKSGLWGTGIEDYVRIVEAWRNEGSLKGVEVQV